MHAETRHIAAPTAYVSEKISPADSSRRRLARAILTPADVADARRACDREVSIFWGSGRVARSGGALRQAGEADGFEEKARQAGSTAFTAVQAMVAKDHVAIAAYARTDDRFAGVRYPLVPCVEASAAATRRRQRGRFESHRFAWSNCRIWAMYGIRSWRTPPAASSRRGRDPAAEARRGDRVNEYSPLDVPSRAWSTPAGDRALDGRGRDRTSWRLAT